MSGLTGAWLLPDVQYAQYYYYITPPKCGVNQKKTQLQLIEHFTVNPMSSLIPERPLHISPSLATTIGLEEAVLLQVLNDCMEYGEAKQQGGYQWFTLCRDKLKEAIAVLGRWRITANQPKPKR